MQIFSIAWRTRRSVVTLGLAGMRTSEGAGLAAAPRRRLSNLSALVAVGLEVLVREVVEAHAVGGWQEVGLRGR